MRVVRDLSHFLRHHRITFSCRRQRGLELLKILLHFRQPRFYFVCALDVLLHQRHLQRFGYQFRIRIFFLRRKPRVVIRQAPVHCHQQRKASNDHPFLNLKVVHNQIFEYSTENSIVSGSVFACVAVFSDPHFIFANEVEFSNDFSSFSFASELTAPTTKCTVTIPLSSFGSIRTTRTPGGNVRSRSMNICVQLMLRACSTPTTNFACSWKPAASCFSKYSCNASRCWSTVT